MQEEKRKPSWSRWLILAVRGGVMLTAVVVLLFVWFREPAATQPAALVVRIQATGDIEVDGREVQPALLRKTLIREQKRLAAGLTDTAARVTLVIEHDANSPQEKVSLTLKTALDAGFTDVNLRAPTGDKK